MKKSKFIWMDRKLVPWEKASVHVLTHALHYGTAVFEGIRCYNTRKGPAIFRLEEHVERLFNSAQIVNIQIPYSKEEIFRAIVKTVKVNKLKECYIRPLVYCGYEHLGVMSVGLPIKVAIAAFGWGSYLGKKTEQKGVKLKTSTYLRPHVNSMMHNSKASGNYLNSALAKDEAVKAGYDEAVMLDANGFIAECTGENIFIVKDGAVITTPIASVLPGITRDSILKLAKDYGIETKEEFFTRDQLYCADEAFITGTASGIIAVASADERKIGNGKMGKITKLLLGKFKEIISGKEIEYENWLTYV